MPMSTCADRVATNTGAGAQVFHKADARSPETLDPTTGNLPWRLPVSRLGVPGKVNIEEDLFRFDCTELHFVDVAPLLEQFVNLTTAAATAKFAERFGPLGLSNQRGVWIPHPLEPDALGRLKHRGHVVIVEPISAWSRYRVEFHLLWRLAAAIREQVSPSLDTFKALQEVGAFARRRYVHCCRGGEFSVD